MMVTKPKGWGGGERERKREREALRAWRYKMQGILPP
jgi:hypothetical protein